jgi:soluble lytic murein transglycosylase-like protein
VSVSALGTSAAAGASGALAASERMQHLQALIAQVEDGPTGFAAALNAAQTSSPATPATASASAYPSVSQEVTQLPGAYQSPAGTGLPTALDAAETSSAASAGAPATGAATTGATTSAGAAYAPLIEQAAARNGVDPAVLYGLIEQESGFDPAATSGAGALGLTQLMPGTAASLGVSEPLNPAQSIEGGARYLGQMLRQFGGNTADALAAYNAGPGAVQQYGGVPPYSETQQYVSKVLANAAAYSAGTGASAGAPASPVPATVAATAAQSAQPALAGATSAPAETIA